MSDALREASYPTRWHVGRSWKTHPLEDACPCTQALCGLVDTDHIHPDCDQHPMQAAKTIRQSHPHDECPG